MAADVATLQVISDTLEENPRASQRELADRAGMSIGLMNAVLKRFVERGWIMLSNVNGRKLAYALTAEGINELAERGKKFAVRTFYLANNYSKTLVEAISKARDEGKSKVILYGDSYIKFLLEYACTMEGMEFENKTAFTGAVAADEIPAIERKEAPSSIEMPFVEESAFCLIGELNSQEEQEKLEKVGCVSLVDLVRGA